MSATHPSISLGAEPEPSRRSLEQLQDTIASAYGARLWETVRQEAKDSVRTDPLLPGTALPGRPVDQIQHANADNTICQAVVRRLLRDSLVYLVTGEERFRQDALTQIEALFDPRRWPQWLDFAHGMFQADLRTGQLGAGVALTYDWLYAHLSAAERTMIVEGLDRCAIRPYLATVPTDPHWLTRPSNWMTLVVGGLASRRLAVRFAAVVVAVRQQYGFTIDRQETTALDRILDDCDSVELVTAELSI